MRKPTARKAMARVDPPEPRTLLCLPPEDDVLDDEGAADEMVLDIALEMASVAGGTYHEGKEITPSSSWPHTTETESRCACVALTHRCASSVIGSDDERGRLQRYTHTITMTTFFSDIHMSVHK